MDESAEMGRREQLSESRMLALRAMGLFVDASRKNPGFAIGQAARIAEKARELDTKPALLGQALLSQADLMDEIRKLGDKTHKETGAARFQPIKPKEARQVVRDDFALASLLSNLTDEQLRDMHSHFNGRPTTKEDRDELLRKAKTFLEPLGIEFPNIAT